MTYHNYVFGEGLQVTNFDQCLRTVMVIGKCTDIFWGIFLVWVWGSGEGAIWKDLFLENISWGKRNSIKRGAGFSSITIKKKMKIHEKHEIHEMKHEKVFSTESKEKH